MSNLTEPLGMTGKESMHVDDWLDEICPDWNDKGLLYAKWVLEYHRLPAWKKLLYAPFMADRAVFCTWEGRRWRCIGASRMGDVWLTADFTKTHGYDKRVMPLECSQWSDKPVAEA